MRNFKASSFEWPERAENRFYFKNSSGSCILFYNNLNPVYVKTGYGEEFIIRKVEVEVIKRSYEDYNFGIDSFIEIIRNSRGNAGKKRVESMADILADLMIERLSTDREFCTLFNIQKEEPVKSMEELMM
jgi:hypothetical protein